MRVVLVMKEQIPLREALRDARRYRRLRILGCAVPDLMMLRSNYQQRSLLQKLDVACLTSLDEIVDSDITLHESRGEPRSRELEEREMENASAALARVDDALARADHALARVLRLEELLASSRAQVDHAQQRVAALEAERRSVRAVLQAGDDDDTVAAADLVCRALTALRLSAGERITPAPAIVDSPGCGDLAVPASSATSSATSQSSPAGEVPLVRGHHRVTRHDSGASFDAVQFIEGNDQYMGWLFGNDAEVVGADGALKIPGHRRYRGSRADAARGEWILCDSRGDLKVLSHAYLVRHYDCPTLPRGAYPAGWDSIGVLYEIRDHGFRGLVGIGVVSRDEEAPTPGVIHVRVIGGGMRDTIVAARDVAPVLIGDRVAAPERDLVGVLTAVDCNPGVRDAFHVRRSDYDVFVCERIEVVRR